MIFSLLVALAVALATWTLGWWGVAIVALLAGFIARGAGGRPWYVALGCLLGWAVLLLIDAAAGPFVSVAKTVSGAMSIPSGALLVVTLLFPALIGWSGGTLGSLGGPSARVGSPNGL
ncbi:MAG: hypothetical protein M3Z05_12265 [Gemmatimonadota bacterium]|nr:hypothetical protein [Gemmatimonadota bacterium]